MCSKSLQRDRRILIGLGVFWLGVSLLGATGCNEGTSPSAVAQLPETAESPDQWAARESDGENSADANSEQGGSNGAGQQEVPQGETADDSRQDGAQREERLPEDFPYADRIRVNQYFPNDAQWLNVGGPLRRQDLEGKFVLLDFWTYACINCLHVLPELKKLEHAYPDELVVIGVHSAKFEAEKNTDNIEDAILRYEIEHPVINDADHRIWKSYGVRSWPTLLLIDPEGYAVWGRSGETKFEELDEVLKRGMAYYRQRGTLDETPIHFNLLAHRQQPTPLRYPSKVLADESSNRLFIADSNHHRIVIADLDGKLLDIIGTGQLGQDDGTYDQATFNHPHGMALADSMLYVADTRNHAIRKVDLRTRQVTTVAGIGQQARSPWPGLENLSPFDPLPDRWVGQPSTTALSSPWDLLVHGDALYIAMAGPHQIWKMTLDEKEIGPYAGNGREDIIDGPLLPKRPFEQGYASFAQPSGLTADGQWLYVADCEGSSIRAVPFDPQKEVRTVVGTAHLPHARLFTFGDRDGGPREALLQHALGVQYHDGKIYVADTFNNKIKAVDAESGYTESLAGTGEAGASDEPAQFAEPAGLTYAGGKLYIADKNNHLIRTYDLQRDEVATLEIEGLEPFEQPVEERVVSFEDAEKRQLERTALKAAGGHIELDVEFQLPTGWKLNELAPLHYTVRFPEDKGVIGRDQVATTTLDPPQAEFSVPLKVSDSGQDTVELGIEYYYCQEGGEGLCRVGSVLFTVPLDIQDDAEQATVTLRYEVIP